MHNATGPRGESIRTHYAKGLRVGSTGMHYAKGPRRNQKDALRQRSSWSDQKEVPTPMAFVVSP